MATTVDIFIKGIAFCYQKEGHWRVLFPFDHCHLVKFSWKREGGTDSTPIPLARRKRDIKITTTNAISTTAQTPEFERDVLDLTETAIQNRLTHSKISVIDDARQKWYDGTAMLKIENAKFSIDNNLPYHPFHPPILYGNNRSGALVSITLPGEIGHTVKATVQMDDGDKLTVLDGTTELIPPITGGGNYTITFDNDCKEIRTLHNDMDMFYEKIIFDSDSDNAKAGRRFRIGEIPYPPKQSVMFGESIAEQFMSFRNAELLSDPPDLVAGKPCLVVKAKDAVNLPSIVPADE